jgi:hypothetical protein
MKLDQRLLDLGFLLEDDVCAMKLDQRLLDLGFLLEDDGVTLHAGPGAREVKRCQFEFRDDGIAVTLPSGEVVWLAGVMNMHLEGQTVEGPGRVGIILGDPFGDP